MIIGTQPYKPHIRLRNGAWIVTNVQLAAYLSNQRPWRLAITHCIVRNNIEKRFYVIGDIVSGTQK